MIGILTGLVVLELLVTVLVVAILVWRSLVDLKEEDHLILGEAEAHLARDQASIRQKATALSRYMKVVGVAWCLLAVVLLGLWVVEGLNLI